MVDEGETVVCCMCGDVGFSDKLFLCSRCRFRFQHSYCSNYYSEANVRVELCDWCQSELKTPRHGGGGSSSGGSLKRSGASRSEYSGERIKQGDNNERGRNPPSGVPSPRQGGRRYKLLKDVMC